MRYVTLLLVNFAIWLWNNIQDVLAVLYLPINILIAVLTRPSSEFLPYVSRLVYGRFHALRRHADIFNISIIDGKVSVALRSYEDDVDEEEKRMNTGKYKNIQACFEETLKRAMHYMYITYEVNESSVYFIQFAVDKGIYMFDFALTKLTLNQECSNEVITLLEKYGFRKSMKEAYPFQDKTFTIIPLSEELTTIAADCGKDRALAVQLAVDIYSHIFKEKKYPHILLG